jgi:hypothetical protein
MRSKIVCCFVAGLMVAGLLSGCGDSDCNCPTCAYLELPDPTLENIWPNEDGTWWSYEYGYRYWGLSGSVFYPESASVPPIPPLTELAHLIDCNEPGPEPEIFSGTYRLAFDGEITTESGVTAQHLKETLDTDGQRRAAAISNPFSPVLLGRLAIARPDLAGKIKALGRARAGSAVPSGHEAHSGRLDGGAQTYNVSEDLLLDAAREPLLIHGYAWAKTQAWIGTYGDLDTLVAWKFLESDLEPCHEFTHRLIPEITDDVYLHCRILRNSAFETPAALFGNTIQCLYVVDYGIWAATDAHGEILGWTRDFDYGMVVYAPTVGPIYDYERCLVSAGDSDYLGIGDVALGLTAAGTLKR